nr:CocE/NonD family hydrolase [Chryseolinea sp.]
MKIISVVFLLLIASIYTYAQDAKKDSIYMRAHYDKVEYQIAMRDGIKLFTIAYIPKDKTKTYPILMNRTCYNASGYGEFKTHSHPSRYLVQDKYILVFQDVRGRYMSEGTFDNMRPNIPGNDRKNKTAIDESSDTWDTIDWLVKNIKGNNGRVGMYGISYPGFYTAAALPDAHPALKASSPQAPISDFFFDDFHHQGAYLQSYTAAFAVFGYQKEGQTKEDWFTDELMRFYGTPVGDGYDFHLQNGPLKNVTEKYHKDNFFWQQIIDHPNYDKFWQDRNLLPHL